MISYFSDFPKKGNFTKKASPYIGTNSFKWYIYFFELYIIEVYEYVTEIFLE